MTRTNDLSTDIQQRELVAQKAMVAKQVEDTSKLHVTAGYVERFYSITCALVEAYFAPTSQSRMSKNFRDSESLWKSSIKKCSQN